MRKPSRIVQAAVIVSLILISSAIFLSQADKIAGKAQTTAITGTMVLFDQNVDSTSYTQLKRLYYEFYLPTASCTGIANYCAGLVDSERSECSSIPIVKVSGRKYYIRIGNSPRGTSSVCSCFTTSGTVTNTQSELVRFSCYLSGSQTSSSTMSANARYLGPDNTANTADDQVICSISGYGTVNGQSNVVLRYPLNSQFTCAASCSGGTTYPNAAISEETNPIGPISHISVSYECS